MTTDWQQIDTVRMNLKSAELRQSLLAYEPHIFAVADLVTIARGSCQLHAIQEDDAPEDRIGELNIPLDQPVMTAKLALNAERFDQLYQLLSKDGPRTIALNLVLDAKLAVSVDGVLWIEEAMSIPIRDIRIEIPLR